MDKQTLFPILNQTVHDEPYVYLDSAASVLPSVFVQKAVVNFLNNDYANVHRGVYEVSQRATHSYESVRQTVQSFINAPTSEQIIFTSGTTHSLNMVATGFGDYFVEEDDIILVSALEHHANLVPWQELAKRKKAQLVYMPLTEEGIVDIEAVDKLLTPQVKIMAVTQASNVLGTVNDVDTLADKIHAVGGIIVVDGAQSTPHFSVNVEKYDFFAFSGHKLGALNGIGVLYGKKHWLDMMRPIQFGGDMIAVVEDYSSSFQQAPLKFEGGTPNIVGVISLKAAIEQLVTFKQQGLEEHVYHLTELAVNELRKIDGIELYTQHASIYQTGIISFNINGIHPHDVATALDMEGIALRAGHHCCQTGMRYLSVHATLRASFYMYNTKQDVEQFIKAIKKVKEFFKYGIDKT